MATIEDYLNDTSKGTNVIPCHICARFANMDVLKKCVHKNFDNGTEITITFKPELSYRWHEGTLCEIVLKTIEKVMCKYKRKYKMVLIGEHSDKGVFHYHGIFDDIGNDYVGKLARRLRRDIGRTEIKNTRYFESYISYMFGSYDKHHPKGEIPEEWHPYSYIVIGDFQE